MLDWKLLEAAQPALLNNEKVYGSFKIINTDRTAGTIVSNEISKNIKLQAYLKIVFTLNLQAQPVKALLP